MFGFYTSWDSRAIIAEGGKFRRLKVQVNRADMKLDFRSGITRGEISNTLNRADREQNWKTSLAAQLPAWTYLFTRERHSSSGRFALLSGQFSLGSSGLADTLRHGKGKRQRPRSDIVGEVREGGKFPVGHLRDTVKLAVESTQQVRARTVQYTGFVLAPGSYHLKFVIRENQTGASVFRDGCAIPDLRKSPLK